MSILEAFALQTDYPLDRYRQVDAMLDFDHPDIQAQVARWPAADSQSDVEIVRRTFRFVRDEIAHSFDISSPRVTARASEVLEVGEGICLAKSHLLVALLRAQGLPAGLGYQRLVDPPAPDAPAGTPGEAFLHGLATVYLPSRGVWLRLDARGNKPGVDAHFDPDVTPGSERLAYTPDPSLGGIDYPTNYPEPPAVVVEFLTSCPDMMVACREGGLPTGLG